MINGILDSGAQSNKIFNDNEENLYREVVVKQNFSSASLLSYLLFEDDEQIAIITDLNPDQKPSSFFGEVEALNR